MTELRSRPLTAGDSENYVPRRADDLLRKAIEGRENVLLAATRGAGTTSLLYGLEAELDDAAYVNAEHANDADEILGSLVARLNVSRSFIPDLRLLTARLDPLAPPEVLKELRSALQESDRRPVLLLDGPLKPEVAFQIFGRWRDEVFGVPATWVVVAHQDRLAEYLTPPVDVFFDAVITLDPLSRDEALDVLARRDPLKRLPPEAREAVIEASDGTPRHLLRLARQRLGDEDAPGHARAHAEATAYLSRGAHMLLAEMQGRGPVAATDEDLGRRLGITDRQMRRNLTELRDAGLVEVVPGGRGAPGRPPTTFQLTGTGRIRGGAG